MKTGEQASGNLTLNHPNWQLLSVCVCVREETPPLCLKASSVNSLRLPVGGADAP